MASQQISSEVPCNTETKSSKKRKRRNKKKTADLLIMDYLQELLENTDGEALFNSLHQNIQFNKLLEAQDLKMDLYSSVLEVVTRISYSHYGPNTLQFMKHLVQSTFFHSIPKFLHSLQIMEKDKLCEHNSDLLNIIQIIRTLLERLPQHAEEMLSIAENIKQLIENTINGENIVIENFKELKIMLTRFVQNGNAEKELQSQTNFYLVQGEPPDDYRTIPTIPTANELLSSEKKFLIPNKINGSYSSNTAYLDTQFRLLREDFVSPLRTGINQFLEKVQSKDILEIRIYKNVQILNKCKHNYNKIIFALRFDLDTFKNVQLQASKFLLYGSLLCLSHDNFETLLFATVEEQDLRFIDTGILYVHLINPKVPDIFNHTFIAVESAAYYEAYLHILEGLKEFNSLSLPFEDYIVRCDKNHDIMPPKYLMNETCYNIKGYSIPILQNNRWPTCEKLGLNESQFLAFRLALTKRFALIQGPPGCGKTFIGLKIVEALLNNHSHKGPILIVCYTNHALDQFLEGILKFHAKNIVRVGGRSFSSKLTSYNLTELRKSYNFKPRLKVEFAKISTCIRKDFAKYNNAIKTITEIGRSFDRKIISEDTLYHLNILNYDQFNEFKKMNISQTNGILVWLSIEFIDFHNEDVLQKSQNSLDIIQMEKQVRKTEKIIGDDNYLNQSTNIEAYSSKEHEAMYNLTVIENQLLQMNLNEINKVHSHTVKGSNPLCLKYPEVPQLFDKLIHVEARRYFEESSRLINGTEEYEEPETDCQLIRTDGYLCDFTKRREVTKSSISKVEGQISVLRTNDCEKDNNRNKDENVALNNEWTLIFNSRKNEQKVLSELDGFKPLSENEAAIIKSKDLWSLHLNKRKQLYLFWVGKYSLQKDDLTSLENNYNENVKLRLEIRDYQNYEILRKADIIGMTTTGAAKNRDLLKLIEPKIVIVEEAAEVLESHIITSLTPACQHLILIGDHQQLQPNPNTYELATKFNLGVSLFERMIINGMPHERLNVQYRMRPEIASLMTHFYKNIKNHDSVLNFGKINGIQSNIFFIQHNHLEKCDRQLRSYSNLHEALFIKALCYYLLLQNYSANQITILTPYSAQMSLFQNLLPKHTFHGIRICTVDNFQGEESDIVLLSFVRSNKAKILGFLSIPNRICVALSRARKGIYCIGNFEMFAEKSELWANIVDNLKMSHSLGQQLLLSCRNHHHTTPVSSENDFIIHVPDGGCTKICNFNLKCGHICKYYCHFYDFQHTEYKCEKSCFKKCDAGHRCKYQCFIKCPKCQVLVERLAPCGHLLFVPCHEKNIFCKLCQDVNETSNKITRYFPPNSNGVLVKTFLKCGHYLMTSPHSSSWNNLKCSLMVEKSLNCGHTVVVSCSIEPDTITCLHPCLVVLNCGHRCNGFCSECNLDFIHRYCIYNCGNI